MENGGVHQAQPIEGTQVVQLRHPFFMSRAKLGTLRGIRRELAALYAATKAGAIAPSDATRLAYILRSTATTLIEGEVEQRVRALEDGELLAGTVQQFGADV